ncbi:MAG: phosphotransferase family protein [Myxococcota bacterium]|nr:phosphotransferase family protein [Myxococcota bacterium]
MPEPRGRDLEATREALAPWLRARLPDATKVELSARAGPSDTGFSSDTLLFDARVEEGGRERVERLVARLEPRGFNVFPHYDVAAQFRILEILGARTDVPVPPVRWLETDEAVLGTPFYVMDRVEGVVPSDSPPMHAGGWVADLSEEERARLWWNGIEVLARIHRLDPFELGLDFAGSPASGADPLEKELGRYEHMVAWGLPEPDRYPLIHRAFAWLRATKPEDEPVGLCWGDSRLANMIFRDLECVAVLDWEMAFLGNPLSDLAWWVTVDRCLSEGIGLPRLAGLPGPEETAERWSALTGRSAEGMAWYQVLSALRFAVIMARIGLQMKHHGILPEDADMDVDNLASSTLARLLEEQGARD